MKHYKVAITFILVLAVLVAAFFGSVYLANKAKERANKNGQGMKQGSYTVENKQFGYKFMLSSNLVSRYDEIQNGFSTTYYLPSETGDADATPSPLFSILALPKDVAQKYAKLCAEDRAVAPMSCANVPGQQDGENNFFYFFIRGSQASELLTATDEATQAKYSQKLESIMAQVEDSISFYDVATAPETLVQHFPDEGFKFSYPTELNTYGEENSSLDLPAQLTLSDQTTSSSLGAVKKILPVRYCAPSGACQNTTQNFAIDVQSIRNLTEDQLLNSGIGPRLAKQQMFGYTVYTYNEGAEGEGINYHFIISENPQQILAVIHRYIDETVLTNYQSAKGFIPYARQKNIVNNLIDSIEFSEPWFKVE